MSFFQKSLVDLVKGIRNAGNDGSPAYISKSIQDIKVRQLSRDAPCAPTPPRPPHPARGAR